MYESIGILQTNRFHDRIAGNEEESVQWTSYGCSVAPFPSLPAVTKHDAMRDLKRLEELVGLEEGLDEAGIENTKSNELEEERRLRHELDKAFESNQCSAYCDLCRRY